jgi:hypothetical protein
LNTNANRSSICTVRSDFDPIGCLRDPIACISGVCFLTSPTIHSVTTLMLPQRSGVCFLTSPTINRVSTLQAAWADDVTHCRLSGQMEDAKHELCHCTDDITHCRLSGQMDEEVPIKVIVASRPCAMLDMLGDNVDTPLEILGFTADNVGRYVEKFVSEAVVRCAFSTGIYTRGCHCVFVTPLLLLKLLHASDQWHSSRMSTISYRCHDKLYPITIGHGGRSGSGAG